MKKLYRFSWYVGRHGNVNGLFVAEEEILEKAIGMNVYFGEILGKHSQIRGTLGREDLEVLSEDQEKIEWLMSLFGTVGCYTISGYNPLKYLVDENGNRIDLMESDFDGEWVEEVSP